MKKLFLLFLLLAFIKMEAQQNRGIEKVDIRRGFYASLSAGLTTPTGEYKTYSDDITNADGQIRYGATEKISGTSQFNLDAGYRFGAFGIGLSIGYFSHELADLSFQSDLYDADFPITTKGGNIDGIYYGTGPDYTFSFGKFSTTTSARIGLMNFSTDTFTGSYNGNDTETPIELLQTELAADGKTSLAYASFGLKLSYDISKQLSLFTKTDYFISLSDGLKVTDKGIALNDINGDKSITIADFDFAAPGLQRFERDRFTKPKMVNVGFGLTYNFKGRKGRNPQTGKEIKNALSKDSKPGDLVYQPPIKEGGRTVEAGQVPEKTVSNDSDDMGDGQNDTKRAADLKKLADELVNAFAINDVAWVNIENDHELAASGGGAGKATFKEYKNKQKSGAAGKAKYKESRSNDEDTDSDGHADALRGIEKSDIRRGMKIKKPSRDKSTNPIMEEDNQLASGDLNNLYPPDSKKKGTGSRFKNLSEITYFAWEIIGADIPNANYVVEITKIDNDGQPQQTFIGKSLQNTNENTHTGEKVNKANKKVAKFKAGKALADIVKRTGDPVPGIGIGEYKWTVTETTTGISSAPSFFTVSDAEIDENCVGYQENSALLMVKIDETSLRNTNTVIDGSEASLAKKRDERMQIRALRTKDARHGYRAKQDDARIKDARIKDARIKDARIKDARMQNAVDKTIEATTEENNKKDIQIDTNTKYLRVANNKTVEISKSYLQLIAPILPCENHSKTINYNWTVKNKALNIEDSFNGNSVKYNFTSNGTYEINVTPTLNGSNLNSFHIIVICN